MTRVAPDIRPAGYPAFFEIRYPAGYPVQSAGYLAGSPDIRLEKIFKQVKSKTADQQIKLQYKILNSGRNFA